MTIHNKPGGNGRGHRFPAPGPRLVQGKGGLIIPEADAARQAQEEAAKWDTKLLAWCPQLGAYDVALGTKGERRPHPTMPGVPVMWVECPVCSTMEGVVRHCANAVLVPKGGDQPAARKAGPMIVPDCAGIEAEGRRAAEACVEAFPGVAAFHVERVDDNGADGRKLAGLVITAVDGSFAVIEAGEGRSARMEIIIDGSDTDDLNRRVLAYGKGLESERPVYFGPYDYCKKLWEESHK